MKVSGVGARAAGLASSYKMNEDERGEHDPVEPHSLIVRRQGRVPGRVPARALYLIAVRLRIMSFKRRRERGEIRSEDPEGEDEPRVPEDEVPGVRWLSELNPAGLIVVKRERRGGGDGRRRRSAR